MTPITCFLGLEDPYVSRADALSWSEYTRRSFKIHFLDGAHFTVVEDRELIVEAISEELDIALSRPGKARPAKKERVTSA